ncbi:hypothetical protein RHMOL_Rhmol04G0128300 [Rhododendron molle]|uniref:Uncharacterized protein n=1 Tax=Rhododendron molle TaxID=49168 RepID=A0ACC0NZN2_RHOML|nr:hypothetical protein RHMOL_Rhmol04G0128300 [Rhododendron molle]
MPRGTEEDLDEELKSFIRKKLREEEYNTLIGVRLTSWDLKRRIRKKLRKDEYKTSRDRHYVFAAGDKTPDLSVRTFQDVIQEYELWREKEKMLRATAKEEEERKAAWLVSRTDEDLLETFQRVCFTHWCTLLLQVWKFARYYVMRVIGMEILSDLMQLYVTCSLEGPVNSSDHGKLKGPPTVDEIKECVNIEQEEGNVTRDGVNH